jgi:hypothetical protein
MLDTWMLSKPDASLGTLVTTEIITHHIHVACRIGRFDVSEQGNVTFGIARSRTARDLLAITDPQGPIDPHLLLATAVIQRGFEAMSVSRPAWGWSLPCGGSLGRVRPCEIRRRPFGRLDVMGDDRGPDCGQSLRRRCFPNCGYGASARLPGYKSDGCGLRWTWIPAAWAASVRASKLHCAEPCSSRATISSARLSSRPGGGSFTSARIRLRSSSVKRGLRPAPDRIPRPLIPSLLKRARWVRTVFGWHFSSVAIS